MPHARATSVGLNPERPWRSADAHTRFLQLCELSRELSLLTRLEGVRLVQGLESLPLYSNSPTSFRLALVSWIRGRACAPVESGKSLGELADRLSSVRMGLTGLHDAELREIAAQAELTHEVVLGLHERKSVAEVATAAISG